MDDVPPPPYTETDIYSHSGRSPAARPGSNDDDASVTASSSHSVIYTPPETPRESHYNFTGADDHRTVTSVHSYFESRPALRRQSSQNLAIMLAVTDDASPNDFPYPSWASEHDTTEQDWQTFLNYLLPNHSSRANSHIADRKLRAEVDSQSPPSPTGRSIAEAQLGQIKSPTDSQHDVDTMIREWNDGFFGPRGVTIHRAPSQTRSPDAAQTPGQQTPTAESQREAQPQTQEQGSRSRWNPFRPLNADGRGLRIGRLTIDGDRVSFGDSFEVDRNGVRWNGQPVEGCPSAPGPGSPGNFPPGLGPWGGFQRGRGFGDRGNFRGGRRGRWWKSGHDHHHGHGHGRGRGRSPSSSSSSSSDSGSSSDSDDSSIGSLPDWDSLKDNQLPTTKQSVSAWLAHPEQPVTKAMLKSLKADIKASRNAPAPAANNNNSSSNSILDTKEPVAREQLRQEVRALLARFKDLKREQKRAARLLRKERREQKRSLRRDRRDRRRAERREQRSLERDFRRAEREAERSARRGPGSGSGFGLGRGMGGSNTFPFGPGGMPLPRVPPPHIPTGLVGDPHMASISPGNLPGMLGTANVNGPFPFNHGAHRPWKATVAHAQQHAEQVRLQAQGQAEQARAHARETSERAVAQANATAKLAQEHAALARDQALRAADEATRGWSRPLPFGVQGSFPFAPPSGVSAAPSQSEGVMDAVENKYEKADALEARIVAHAGKLIELRDEIAREEERDGEKVKTEKGGQDEKKKAVGKSEAYKEAEALEREIEAMGRDVERLRLEADEELARKMAEEEEEQRGR
ncbi:hypothetical protein GGS26DRAFT_360209 [Hypomontagnella submonticulosa]|nr:hypothetical protein GGS26DRAFT_360209 [Hypomontagnella submonticulosa]